MNLQSAIHPTDGLAHGGIGLHQHQGEAVDEENQVGAAFGRTGPEGVLGGDQILVLVEVVEIDQAHGDVLVTRPKGHRALTAQPGGELFVGANQAVGTYREHDGAQLIEHFVGALRLLGDAEIEAHEGLTDIFFDEDIVNAPRQADGEDVVSADAFGVVTDGEVRRGGFADPAFGDGLLPAEGIPDEIFDRF